MTGKGRVPPSPEKMAQRLERLEAAIEEIAGIVLEAETEKEQAIQAITDGLT